VGVTVFWAVCPGINSKTPTTYHEQREVGTGRRVRRILGWGTARGHRAVCAAATQLRGRVDLGWEILPPRPRNGVATHGHDGGAAASSARASDATVCPEPGLWKANGKPVRRLVPGVGQGRVGAATRPPPTICRVGSSCAQTVVGGCLGLVAVVWAFRVHDWQCSGGW